MIEAAAGLIVLWFMSGERSNSARAERLAQQLIAVSFALVAVYHAVQSIVDLAGGEHPSASWLGIGLSIVTLIVMLPLAIAKRRVGHALASAATASESRQTMLCAYLSAALLTGLVANAVAGWWWADPLVALATGAVAGREAREAWRGNSCDCCELLGQSRPFCRRTAVARQHDDSRTRGRKRDLVMNELVASWQPLGIRGGRTPSSRASRGLRDCRTSRRHAPPRRHRWSADQSNQRLGAGARASDQRRFVGCWNRQ